MTKPTLKERQKQLRQDAILEAAQELIGERGYAEVSMDDVAARVGISKATLYQHHASKEDLAVAVITTSLEQAEQTLRELDPQQPAIERIETSLRASLERRANLWGTGMKLLPSRIYSDSRFREAQSRVTELAAELVEEAKRDGDLRPELSTAVIVRMFSRLYADDYDDLVSHGAVSTDALRATLLGVVLDGLRTTRSRRTP